MDFSEAWDHACSTVGLAARKGSLITLKKLVERGKPVDVADNRGWRPLHEAVNKHHIECVRFLLTQENTDINWRTFQDDTPLHLACARNSSDIVKLLLDHGADIDVKNHEWKTPLILAVANSGKEIVSLLLEHSIDVNTMDVNEWTALHFAVANKNLALLKLLLRYNADFRVRDEHGRTAMFIACENKCFECLKVLFEFASLKGERNIINVTANDGANALIIAAEKGCLKTLKYLIENGVNVNQITNDGYLALHLAVAVAGDIECVKLLLEKTNLEILKQPNVRDLIHLAVARKRCEMLQLLLTTNLPFDVECKLPHVPKLVIYDRYNVQRANFQIENATFTPLGRAVYTDDEKSMELLLKAGANPNAISPMCIPPLTLCFDHHNSNHDILRTLLKAGAVVNYSKVDWCESEAAVLAIHYNKWDYLNTLILAGVDDISFTFNIVTSEERGTFTL
uniref:Uncharacterized protein n=1 Tax=Strigamia maritima TaxID=126957 RepID=T1IJC3_STRMM